MNFPELPSFVESIIRKLKDAGYQAYLVGGPVRDTFIKRPVSDWDVATSATPEKIKKLFSDTRLFALKHETVTLIHEGTPFEITGFRGEANSIQDDLAHRDFTINAMAYDPESGRIVDPFGGMEDAKKKIIKAVGDPSLRFSEDPLRLLRSVRISLELGFRIEKNTYYSIKDNASRLKIVAPERIRGELMKILLSEEPSKGLKMMLQSGLIDYFLPELREGHLMRQNAYHRYTVLKHIMLSVDAVEAKPHLRLTALLHDIAKPRTRKKTQGKWRFLGHEKASAALARDILFRLRFSKAMASRVINLIENHMIGYTPGWSDGAIRRLIRKVGVENIDDLIEFRRADLIAHGLEHKGLELFKEFVNRTGDILSEDFPKKINKLAVDGRDIIRTLDIQPGPQVGNILKELMEMVTDRPELNSREKLISILEKMKGTRSQ
ncbi:CCA tRNA nucleotidyltransferase [Thermodesulfobacteriota bacterium]